MIDDNNGWIALRMDCAITPQFIENSERMMLKYPQVECPVSHHFGPGIYIREVKIPAGTLAIGHRQKTEHLNVMISGVVKMLNKDGTIMELHAPCTFVGKPGRKIGFILEDVVWQNIYATEEKRVDVLENTYLDKSPVFIENKKTISDIESLAREEDRTDFIKMIAEYGLDEKTVRYQSENTEDMISNPYGYPGIAVFESSIEGMGLFSSSGFAPDEIISPARIAEKRTPAGRYTNHSKHPNAKMVLMENGDINLVAIEYISGCKGGGCGEEITIDYRQALSLSNVLPVGGTKCLG